MRLLTFNAHEAYIHALAQIGFEWDVIDGLPGRYTSSWDTRIRPVPDNIRLLSVKEALSAGNSYTCIIGHSIDDLLLVKSLPLPKILVIHVSLSGYIAQEKSETGKEEMQRLLNTYLDKIGAIAVSVSTMKQQTWGLMGPVIPFYIDTDFFSGYKGEIAGGLRVANQISKKSLLLDWQTHRQIAKEMPIKIVGYNPDLPGVERARDLKDLRQFYRDYRFYLHTACYDFEDGFNMASLEAMATGMPVVCAAHPSAPVINGVNGYISEDVEELREDAEKLLADKELARRMGQAAREYVKENHSLQKFRRSWQQAIELAINFYR